MFTSFLRRFSGRPQFPFATIGDLFREFDRLHWQDLDSRSTESVLRCHALPVFGHIATGDLTPLQVVQWHRGMRNKAATANRVVVMGRQAWAALLPGHQNPFAGVKMFPERARTRSLTDDERERFFAALADMRKGVRPGVSEVVADAIWCIRLTGARPGEMLRLARRQVDLHAEVAVIDVHKTDADVGARHIQLGGCIDVIARRCAASAKMGSPWVFASTRSKAGHVTNIRSAFFRACERAGIVDTWDLVPHLLRHDAAQALDDIGTDLRRIQEVLGHANAETTRRYLRRSPAKAAEAVRLAGRKMGDVQW